VGVFQSVRERHRRSRHVQRNAPPAADRLAYARDRVASYGEMMAAQTEAARKAAAAMAGLTDPSVVRRAVTITGMRQIAMVNFDLLFEFELTVLPDDRPGYPAMTQQLVSQEEVRRLVPGRTVEATVDLSNSGSIWLDLGSLGSLGSLK
jgi:hypothetical protein